MAQNVVKVLKGSLHTQRNNTYTIIVRSSSLDSAVWSKSGCGSRSSEIVVESGRVWKEGSTLGSCVSHKERDWILNKYLLDVSPWFDICSPKVEM